MNIIPYALIVVVLLHGSSFCMDKIVLGIISLSAEPGVCTMLKATELNNKGCKFNSAHYENSEHRAFDQEEGIGYSAFNCIIKPCMEYQIACLFGDMMQFAFDLNGDIEKEKTE